MKFDFVSLIRAIVRLPPFIKKTYRSLLWIGRKTTFRIRDLFSFKEKKKEYYIMDYKGFRKVELKKNGRIINHKGKCR